jgi:peptidoglycan/LPS O-acetylase OafA/YrhL
MAALGTGDADSINCSQETLEPRLESITATTRDRQHLAHPTYRPDIDGLRAVAVLSVVVSHAFPSLLKGGFVGVDIFFVISGFLISSILFGSLEQSRFSFGEFYSRRIRRIFPALVTVLVVCLGVGWPLMLADEYQALGKHVAAGSAFVSNFALWNESGYFDAAAASKPLLHLWSLAIEEQFYLIWPPLLWLAYRRHRSFLALTVLIALASFAFNVWSVSRDPIAAFYSPLSRSWELMIGGILAYLTLHRPHLLARYSLFRSATGLLLIAAALMLVNNTVPFPGWWALLPSIGAFLVLSASPADPLTRRLLGNRVMVGVGLVSYPLYLWHWPALFLVSLIGNSSRSERLAAVVASLVLATLTYHFIEKPMRRSKRTLASVSVLLAGMGVCGLIGLSSFLAGGFSFRLPPQFRALSHISPGDVPTQCFLKNRADFPAPCTALHQRPAILVWGDSHANSLAAGFIPLRDSGRISLLQVTGAACPPLLHFKSNGNQTCEAINDYALSVVRTEKPDVVLLHAKWESDTYDLSKLDLTVRQIRDAGIKEIVLLGPVPRWNGTMLRSVFRCWRPTTPTEAFPSFSTCGLDPHVTQVDASLPETARRLNITYLSAYAVLCDARGCLTHVSDGSGQLITYDSGHLSTSAARFLAGAIVTDLFENRLSTRPPL